MSEERKIGRVENYTNPFLVSAGILLFVLLLTIKVIYGFLFAILAGWSFDKLISLKRDRLR